MTLTSKRCTAEIRITAKSKRIASSICDALAPDLSGFSKSGESASISLRGSNVIMKFEAKDVPSLRANLNSSLLLSGALIRCLTV